MPGFYNVISDERQGKFVINVSVIDNLHVFVYLPDGISICHDKILF